MGKYIQPRTHTHTINVVVNKSLTDNKQLDFKHEILFDLSFSQTVYSQCLMGTTLFLSINWVIKTDTFGCLCGSESGKL